MKVVMSSVGKFHSFDLARQLHRRGQLLRIHTGYPMFKLRSEGLPADLIQTHPWLRTPYMAVAGRISLSAPVARAAEHCTMRDLDRRVSRCLEAADVFVGLSGGALLSGRTARAMGMVHVCDRGSTHIQAQARLLTEEFARWGEPCDDMHPATVDVELQEYAEADAITVPSSFARRTFLAHGVPEGKVHVLPYGVDLGRFQPRSVPASDTFDVLFAGGASLRKGVPYLIQAFMRLKHPAKRLRFAGQFPPSLQHKLRQRGHWHEAIELLGHLSTDALCELMSRSHVLVLPSVEDGFGLVMAQAMACGCPVIASLNTGAEDLFADGREGFHVPAASAEHLLERLQQLADQPDVRRCMAQAARLKVETLNGWAQYGEAASLLFQRLRSQGARAS